MESPEKSQIIPNPWEAWHSDNAEQIVAKTTGQPVNFLASTDNQKIQKIEDKKLLELYSDIVEHFDISKRFGLAQVDRWHKRIFESIYHFAGKHRTVQLEKGSGDEHWVWQLSFLGEVPTLNEEIKRLSSRTYEDVNELCSELAELMSLFLLIHPYREGNGRISRLVNDVILAKNGLPFIGLELKAEDNYIQAVHSGYTGNVQPLKEIILRKLLEKIDG